MLTDAILYPSIRSSQNLFEDINNLIDLFDRIVVNEGNSDDAIGRIIIRRYLGDQGVCVEVAIPNTDLCTKLRHI